MRLAVFDIEGDGLHPSKIWCLSKWENGKLLSTTDYDKMRKFLTTVDVLVGHNITRWDIPHLERLLDINISAMLVDTLFISWYLQPNRVMHGLEWYGEDYGIPKPKIECWDSLTTEEYVHRCEEDVKINTRLWEDQLHHLKLLYGSEEEAWRLINYLSFKADCARQQEKNRWKLDIELATRTLEKLSKEREEKLVGLGRVMPERPVYAKREPPKKPYKVNGELSATGLRWKALTEANNKPFSYAGSIKEVTKTEPPNPQSTPQIKDWLFSLGWKPETFKYVRDKETGDVRKIEQVNRPHGGGVCPSILRLAGGGGTSGVLLLDGLSILSHRISILKGFLASVDEEGYVQAQVQGLTNTLRFKHKTVVNLPGVDKPYGKEIRGCLIAPDGYELCGADMSSLEDRTKQHYMWNHDPEYVKEMMTDDFDPHLDICMAGGLLSRDDVSSHKNGTSNHSGARKLGKAANYACVYGAGGATVARSAGISEREGTKLVEAYWKRNWAVEAIAAEQVVKTCKRQKWLYNPVSKLWYSLRHEKDRFSTLNQGTGVWCFDTWGKHTTGGPPVVAQMHDEYVWLVRKGKRDKLTNFLRNAIEKTNQELGLNRELDIDVQFGNNYSQIH